MTALWFSVKGSPRRAGADRLFAVCIIPSTDSRSDAGGAIAGVACWGITMVQGSNFTRNSATGPGGAITLISCAMALQSCRFNGNEAQTNGGAVAAADRRTLNSTYRTIPNLVVASCQFDSNRAVKRDGGAVFTQDMNATMFVSNFSRNSAGNSGGAIGMRSNLDAGIRGCRFANNTAAAVGGAAYVTTTLNARIRDSTFEYNRAQRTAGALSVTQSNCLLLLNVDLNGNRADGRGGALQLQPIGVDGDNAFAAQGLCVGNFTEEIRAYMSPAGQSLLGTVYEQLPPYNATVVYDGGYMYDNASNAYIETTALFQRGGVQTPVIEATGPQQLLAITGAMQLATGSSVRFTAGSEQRRRGSSAQGISPGTELRTNTSRMVLVPSRDGTLLFDNVLDSTAMFQFTSYYLLGDGTEVQAAAGSVVTLPSADGSAGGGSETLSAATRVTVRGTQWQLANGTVLQPGNGTVRNADSEMVLHVGSYAKLPGEVGRLCRTSFSGALYRADPYAYDPVRFQVGTWERGACIAQLPAMPRALISD